jgi:hypothetical protein
MRRWAVAAASLAVALAGGSASIVLTAQSPALDIDVSQSNSAVRDRVDGAARLAIASYTEWLGPPPVQRLSIGSAPADVIVSVPLWDSAAVMTIESQVASGIAAAWLSTVTGNEAWKRGAAGYLQSRVVEQRFNQQFFFNAYTYDSSCLFGCRVRWAHHALPISRWQALQDPMAIAFASLERELGWPMLQGALRAAVIAGGGDPVGTMSAAAGRDLAPIFSAAADGAMIDHAVAGFTSAGGACDGCFRTAVTLIREGPLPFSLLLRVEFADGQRIDLPWQGRDRVSIESAAPAVAVHLDPDRVLLLDRNTLNNARPRQAPTNVPVWKWMARWLAWLQDAMLTQTFPV